MESRPDAVARGVAKIGLRAGDLGGQDVVGWARTLRLLALGGMGAVFEGVNTSLGNKRVAVKIPYPQYSGARIAQEIEAALHASAEHPDIVNILDHGVIPDSSPYIVMEYVKGESLGVRLS